MDGVEDFVNYFGTVGNTLKSHCICKRFERYCRLLTFPWILRVEEGFSVYLLSYTLTPMKECVDGEGGQGKQNISKVMVNRLSRV